jgi:hypothetical protein
VGGVARQVGSHQGPISCGAIEVVNASPRRSWCHSASAVSAASASSQTGVIARITNLITHTYSAWCKLVTLGGSGAPRRLPMPRRCAAAADGQAGSASERSTIAHHDASASSTSLSTADSRSHASG